ncbi:MAG: hypothetical protein HQ525_12190 [Anaerolineae bacterium]|nr:hypothetical protein [Anaerolineae bacterium]
MKIFNYRIQQAPWRTRRQKAGAVLLAIVGASMIAALYLSVSSRSTLVAREIQTLERHISLGKQENANLKTELARLLSHEAISGRSDALDFQLAPVDETHYIIVPGYDGRQPITLATNADQSTTNLSLSAKYSQSLFDWFESQVQRGGFR